MSGSEGSAVGCSEGYKAVSRRLIVQPNGSLSWSQACLFLGLVCVLSFGIAGVFLAMGYWMIFPFAGLEMLALALGLHVSMRASRYREVLSFGPETLVVEAGTGNLEHRWEFPCLWVRVTLLPPSGANSRSRLLLACSGNECEIGACLTEAERESLAERVRALLAEQKKQVLTSGQQQQRENWNAIQGLVE